MFASYNTNNGILTICEYISKEEFFQKAAFFPKGSWRTWSNV